MSNDVETHGSAPEEGTEARAALDRHMRVLEEPDTAVLEISRTPRDPARPDGSRLVSKRTRGSRVKS